MDPFKSLRIFYGKQPIIDFVCEGVIIINFKLVCAVFVLLVVSTNCLV